MTSLPWRVMGLCQTLLNNQCEFISNTASAKVSLFHALLFLFNGSNRNKTNWIVNKFGFTILASNSQQENLSLLINGIALRWKPLHWEDRCATAHIKNATENWTAQNNTLYRRLQNLSSQLHAVSLRNIVLFFGKHLILRLVRWIK